MSLLISTCFRASFEIVGASDNVDRFVERVQKLALCKKYKCVWICESFSGNPACPPYVILVSDNYDRLVEFINRIPRMARGRKVYYLDWEISE